MPKTSLLAVVAVVAWTLSGFTVPTAAAPAPIAAAVAASSAPGSAPGRPLPLGRRVEFGAFVDGMPGGAGVLTGFEALIGRDTDIASYYYGYGDVFPGPLETAYSDGGDRTVLVSWDMGPTRFTDWASGTEDHYLDVIAAAARAWPGELYVRPWPEMNGDWQQFQPTPSGDKPYGGTYREFRAAWRHVVTYLRQHGADNLRWVFNPTADTYAGTTPARRIWPGSRYVDVLGLDGYNWGDSENGLRWRGFDDIFREQYRNLVRLDRSAPVWICETASKEPAVADGAPVDPRHSKRRWIRQMLASRAMPEVTAIVWFDALKERDWRVASSPGALAALRRGLGA